MIVEPGQDLVPVKMREIKVDLALENAMPSAPRSVRSGPAWSMIFFPDTYWEKNKNLKLENCYLQE